jgi:hypothetical protein
MKFSSQIQIKPNTETRERFSNEKTLLEFLKGLFIKKQVTVIEETFSAPDILGRLNSALKSSGITNLVRVSHDDTEFYLDKENQPNDLDKVIEEFSDTLRNSFERFYEKIAVIVEINHEGIDFMIELDLLRVHPVGESPIQIYISGVPGYTGKGNIESRFKLFVEKLEQNICKVLEIKDIKLSFLKGYSFQIPENKLIEQQNRLKPRTPDSQKCIFFPLYGVTLGETKISELEEIGVHATDYDSANILYNYFTVNGIRFWYNNKTANQIYITYTDPLPEQWRNCGLDWELSYNEWIKLFNDLGFHISIVKNPKKEWYNGQQTLVAEFHASKMTKKNRHLVIEAYFNYSKQSSVMSKGTIYSLRFGG